MYNRYIPQSDGSYRRSSVGEPPPCPERPPCEPRQHRDSVGSFLHDLLPVNLDTGDLMVILLLLLISGDCKEDQNTALLTLALYLFL